MTLKPNVKSQKKRNEAQYYEAIKNSLCLAMGNYPDSAKTYQPQAGLSEHMPKLVYFEIIGGKNVFSENLKKVFDDDTLNIIRDEHIYPDLVGYAQKNSQSPKEVIIAEIKDEPIRLNTVAKTRFYKEIFNASFAFLISTHEISEEKVRFLLKKPSMNQGVIIAKFIPSSIQSPQFENLGHFETNAKFKETVPDFLHFWLRPKETESKPKPKLSLLNKMFKH